MQQQQTEQRQQTAAAACSNRLHPTPEMADAPQLTLSPDSSLRTKMVAASTARAQIRPSGIARLTSRVVFYTRDIEDRSYASAYVDTYIPLAGQADQFFLPRYTGFREATIFRTAGDAIVIGVTASDQHYIQDDHNEMFRIVNDPAAGTGGRDRLLRSPHTKGRAISNWAAVKKECLESMDDIVTQEEDGVYVKPARTGIKIVTFGGLGFRDRVRSMHAEQYVGMVAGWLYSAADADTYTSSVHNIHSYISITSVRHSLHA
eukprot:COSAG01_NODE_247_length_20443_cov_52.339543_20_plen_261_part_00